MAKYKYQYDKQGKPINLPFEFEWYPEMYESREEMEESLDWLMDDYRRDVDRHAAGYSAAMERERQRTEPRELTALRHGTAEEKQRAVETTRLTNESIRLYDEVTKESNPKKALELKRIADNVRKQAQELAREDYSFEIKEKQDAKQWGEKELDGAMDWSPKRVKENLKDLHGKCQGHRDLSTKPGHFYIVDEREMAVKKLNSPNIPPSEIEARIGTTNPDVLMLKLGGHGIQTGKKEEPAKKEPAQAKEEPKKGGGFQIEVNPSILPGRK